MKIRVKPKNPDVTVLDSAGRRIPIDGKEVEKDTHILRRIKDGDLEAVVDSKAKPTDKGGK